MTYSKSAVLSGGLEAGGTKFVCMIASGPGDIRDEIRFATTTPDETIDRAIDFFKRVTTLRAIGVGSFGPIDLRRDSASYGFITSTPKPKWANTDLVGKLKAALNIPIAFDTDVNAAAYGEYRWGTLQNFDPGIYITIGTGIGGGVIVNRQPIHGLIHPEIGHMFIPHDRSIDPFPGVCPFHQDCFEGLASGPALRSRWKQPAETLPIDHPAWKLEAKYVAYALSNLIVSYSPQRIVLGGGVMQRQELFPMIRR
ncbi:MAG TPA: ROK family protein, partial [Anaerolineae bacterium]|nr:ROK family protein [Anaerolineae bacterium]